MTELRLALAGSPIAASPSPAMHTAALNHLQLAGSYTLRPTTPADVTDLMGEARSGRWTGLNITTPLKTRVAAEVQCVGTASRAGAVNTLWREGDRWVGTLTDVTGVISPLRSRGYGGGQALVLGAGGAARAAVLALEALGAEVHVAARRVEQAQKILRELRPGRPGRAWPLTSDLGEILGDVGAVIQATPVGAAPVGANLSHPIPWDRAAPGLIAFEMLYRPRRTAFLESAAQIGAETIEGWEMLVAQGAESFEIWTGAPAPEEVMANAVREILSSPDPD